MSSEYRRRKSPLTGKYWKISQEIVDQYDRYRQHVKRHGRRSSFKTIFKGETP